MPDSIEDALELETLDGDTLFRSVRLWKPLTGRGVFGGQTLALSTWAATRSVSPELKLHSLHSYCASRRRGRTRSAGLTSSLAPSPQLRRLQHPHRLPRRQDP